MKKIFLIIVLLAFIAGCAEEGINVVRINSSEQPAPNTTAPSPPAIPPLPATVPAPVANTTAPANVTNATQPIQQTQTKADLELNSFILSDLNILQNDNFDVKFKIKNSGFEPIGNFEYSVKIMKGNDVVKQDVFNYTGSINPSNTSAKITLTYSLPDTGTYDVVAKLDPFNLFAESNENNNEGRQRIYVITATGNSSKSPSNNSTPTGSCIDTDGGKNYNIKGSCQDNEGTSTADICVETNKLWEWYCSSGRCTHEEHTCLCREGACV